MTVCFLKILYSNLFLCYHISSSSCRPPCAVDASGDGNTNARDDGCCQRTHQCGSRSSGVECGRICAGGTAEAGPRGSRTGNTGCFCFWICKQGGGGATIISDEADGGNRTVSLRGLPEADSGSRNECAHGGRPQGRRDGIDDDVGGEEGPRRGSIHARRFVLLNFGFE